MYYTKTEREELEKIGRLLMDEGRLAHAERLIVDAVIRDCKARGESLEQNLQNFMHEGLSAPH